MAFYTLHEVRKHRNKNDLWVVYKGQVYDVSDFVQKHPGGSAVLLREADRDITDVMHDAESHQHSKAAYQILKKYRIGELKSNSKKKAKSRKASKRKNATDKVVPGGSEAEEIQNADWREDELINWDEPLVWQVGKLGKNYMEWVHTPVDKRIRFFHSNICEYLSSCSWWVVPLVWLPVMAAYLYNSFLNFQEVGEEIWLPWLYGGVTVTKWWMPILFTVGAFMWSFFEYIVHRWFFHLEPPANSKLLITLHFLAHGQHHKAPMDKDRLVFPPVPATAFAITIIFLYTSWFPKAMAQSMLAGTALGYTIYDMMHYYLHHGEPSLQYFKSLKNYHVRHHYVNQQKGFGISSKFWDYPFGTLIPDAGSSKK